MRGLVCLVPALGIVACGGHSLEEPWVAMYKSRGGVQCQSTGSSLATLQTELTSAGIQVRSSSCGHDGLARIAMCGAEDGGIGIFELPQPQQSAAQGLGFNLLSALPGAVRTPC